MKRAQSMAQAAWSRPGLRFSSWSCVGPRRRPLSNQLNNIDGDDSTVLSSTQEAAAAEPFLSTSEVSTSSSTSKALELPVSSSEGVEWTAGSPDDSILGGGDDQVDDCEDILEQERDENHMTEVELWQQLEQELYDEAETEDGDDVVKEIREEEAAAIAEISDNESESSVPNTKEVHRFFPPGKIMHIVTLLPDEEAHESDTDSNCNGNLEQEQPTEAKVGIFLTRRSLYSKLRLSQTMISDHFMPVYRRQIEKLIKELQEDTSNTLHCSEENIL